jgi:hypothetical protein
LRQCVCVHPQLFFSCQQLLQYTALLSKAHPIETEAAPRDHGNCKLPCAYCLLLTVRVFCFSKNLELVMVYIFLATLKDWTHSMQDALPVVASVRSKYMTWTRVFL